MTYYRGGLSAFGRRYGGGSGLGQALIEPSLEQGWTPEDARMLDILGSKGTGSPEGQALIKEIEAVHGAGNWFTEWTRLQDYYTAKYLAAKSDAERLAQLQASTTDKDYGTQFVPAGAIPYSIHDINAFQAMSAEEQAAFLLAFADPNAAGYFSAVAGTKPGVQELMDAARGIQYMGASGKLYPTYEAMVAANDIPKGTVTIYPAGGGDPITVEQGTPVDVETVFGPGSGTSTVPQWTAPTPPPPIETTYPIATAPVKPTDGTTEGGVSIPSGSPTPTPVLTPPPSGGGTTFTSTTKPPTSKPAGSGAPAPGPTGPVPDDDTMTGPVAQAGPGGGALALLAVLGIGLALMRKR